jgi:hypothetical protein
MMRVMALMLPIFGLALGPAMAATSVEPWLPIAGVALEGNTAPFNLYGATSAAANYEITQWGYPAEMEPFQQTLFGAWVSNNAGEDVWWSGQKVAIKQDDSNEACLDAAGNPQEYDSFVAPAPNAVNSVYGNNTKFPTLDQLASLNLNGQVTLYAAGQASGAPCGWNATSVAFQLILSDNAVQPPQMIWYFVEIAKCDPGCNDPQADTTSTQWYWTGAAAPSPNASATLVQFGMTDGIALYGEARLTAVGASETVTINLLPRLAAMITSGAYGMDPNVADWRVVGETIGQSTWGNMVTATVWNGFMLSWTLN